MIEWFIPAIVGYQMIHHTPRKILKETFELDVSISSDSKKPVNTDYIKNKCSNNELGFFLNQSKEISKNFFDITKTKGNDLPKDIDIFTYSFPCQDISNQGKQKGFEKGSKTRSGLVWEVGRILHEIKDSGNKLPKYLLLENVKAMIQDKHLNTYKEWIKELNELGYESRRYVLNAADFGSIQNRERVFVISVRKDFKEEIGFEFPNMESKIKKTKKTFKSILSDDIPYTEKFNKYELLMSDKPNKNNILKYKLQNYTNFQSENYVYDINYYGPTLTASGAMSRIKLYFGTNKIREMSAMECFKYMGFTDKDYMLAASSNLITENKLIYLCGNSISIEVLEAIFKEFRF